MENDRKTLEQRWAYALQSAEFGVWDLEPLNQVVHYSPQWKSMLGYDHADEPDSTSVWRSRVHPDDLQPMLDALTRHLQGHEAMYEHEFRLRAADGGYRWVLSRGRVVERNAEGVALRMVGTLTDITDRRLAATLRAERDRAEADSRAKTEFLSRMSHELRTPLNAVIGFAQVMAASIDSSSADEQLEFLGHIEDAGWQLLAMVDDVLDLARAQTGQIELERQAVDLGPLLDVVAADLRTKARRRGVALQVDAAAGPARALADPKRLRQVLTNLVDNAIKYNREGGSVTLSVTTSATACRLAVVDTGLGIPAAQMPHLFEPFNRLGRADDGVAGVGIGLVLTRWLVEHMGGRIAVHSQEGVGTRVEVTLLAADASAHGAATPQAMAVPAGQ